MRAIRTAVSVSIVAVVLTLGIAAAPYQASSQAQTSGANQWRGTVPQGSAIEIKGVNGDIKATAASGPEVEVSADMRGRRSNPQDVRIDIVPHSDGVTICAVYPSSDGQPNECRPGDEGRMNVRDNDVTVSFAVRVPAGVRFIGRTVNGDITAESMAAPVALKTVNGQATFTTSAYGEASTVNGTIRGSMGSSAWNEALRFHTVNGSIELDLPGDANTDIRAQTVNGEITTDFPITMTGRISRRQMNGTIGAGGRSLNLETVNGSVVLRRR